MKETGLPLEESDALERWELPEKQQLRGIYSARPVEGGILFSSSSQPGITFVDTSAPGAVNFHPVSLAEISGSDFPLSMYARGNRVWAVDARANSLFELIWNPGDLSLNLVHQTGAQLDEPHGVCLLDDMPVVVNRGCSNIVVFDSSLRPESSLPAGERHVESWRFPPVAANGLAAYSLVSVHRPRSIYRSAEYLVVIDAVGIHKIPLDGSQEINVKLSPGYWRQAAALPNNAFLLLEEMRGMLFHLNADNSLTRIPTQENICALWQEGSKWLCAARSGEIYAYSIEKTAARFGNSQPPAADTLILQDSAPSKHGEISRFSMILANTGSIESEPAECRKTLESVYDRLELSVSVISESCSLLNPGNIHNQNIGFSKPPDDLPVFNHTQSTLPRTNYSDEVNAALERIREEILIMGLGQRIVIELSTHYSGGMASVLRSRLSELAVGLFRQYENLNSAIRSALKEKTDAESLEKVHIEFTLLYPLLVQLLSFAVRSLTLHDTLAGDTSLDARQRQHLSSFAWPGDWRSAVAETSDLEELATLAKECHQHLNNYQEAMFPAFEQANSLIRKMWRLYLKTAEAGKGGFFIPVPRISSHKELSSLIKAIGKKWQESDPDIDESAASASKDQQEYELGGEFLADEGLQWALFKRLTLTEDAERLATLPAVFKPGLSYRKASDDLEASGAFSLSYEHLRELEIHMAQRPVALLHAALARENASDEEIHHLWRRQFLRALVADERSLDIVFQCARYQVSPAVLMDWFEACKGWFRSIAGITRIAQRLYLANGRNDDAAEQFDIEETLSLQPAQVIYRKLISLRTLSKEKWHQECGRLAEIQNGSYFSSLAEAVNNLQNKQFTRALESLAGIEKPDSGSCFIAAQCEFHLGNHQAAEKLLEEALRLQPGMAYALFLKAVSAMDSGEKDKALAFTSSLLAQPESPLLTLLLAAMLSSTTSVKTKLTGSLAKLVIPAPFADWVYFLLFVRDDDLNSKTEISPEDLDRHIEQVTGDHQKFLNMLLLEKDRIAASKHLNLQFAAGKMRTAFSSGILAWWFFKNKESGQAAAHAARALSAVPSRHLVSLLTEEVVNSEDLRRAYASVKNNPGYDKQ